MFVDYKSILEVARWWTMVHVGWVTGWQQGLSRFAERTKLELYDK